MQRQDAGLDTSLCQTTSQSTCCPRSRRFHSLRGLSLEALLFFSSFLLSPSACWTAPLTRAGGLRSGGHRLGNGPVVLAPAFVFEKKNLVSCSWLVSCGVRLLTCASLSSCTGRRKWLEERFEGRFAVVVVRPFVSLVLTGRSSVLSRRCKRR